ncbi:MAG: class I mannose-6-phosphate isomerase [Neisseriaceae bacterium]|nr:MAG: class I mannose-6-phosphate isomerase [Neisseriaceae bacterium]
MKELIFLEPIFKERIWGGNRLATEFGYNIPNNKTGEAWVISAHKNGDCQVKNGTYKGLKLSQLWQQYPKIFNSSSKNAEFPLMVKIIDAADDLSVQVHPNDEFAKTHENDLGKEECWYILDAEPNAEIIYGHTAKNKDELDSMIDNNQWNKLLVNTSAQKGDFFNVPTGTVHAIKKGLLILEVQQSSDTTYRLYDYDRRDDKGDLRELHLDKAKQVINVPHDNDTQQCKVIKSNNLITHMRLLQNNYFSVELIRNTSTNIINKPNQYWLASVINGNGQINNQMVRKGDSFIIQSSTKELRFSGNIELIITYEVS